MPKVTVDGETYDVPGGVMADREFRQQVDASEDEDLYRVTPNGYHLLERGRDVEVSDGEQYGKVLRFVGAGSEDAGADAQDAPPSESRVWQQLLDATLAADPQTLGLRHQRTVREVASLDDAKLEQRADRAQELLRRGDSVGDGDRVEAYTLLAEAAARREARGAVAHDAVVPVEVDGATHYLPQGTVSAGTLRGWIGSNDEEVYEIGDDGNVQLLGPEQPVAVREGQRYGTVLRFVGAADTKGRNVKRLNNEIRMLERYYGPERITWHEGYNWVAIEDFPLPRGFNQPTTHLVVMIPPRYGYGPPIKFCFVTRNLKLTHHGRERAVPHYWMRENYAPDADRFYSKGWAYLCVHPQDDVWKPREHTIWTYLKQVYAFLSDPLRW